MKQRQVQTEQTEQTEQQMEQDDSLWRWVLLRVISGGQAWSEARVRRAVAVCAKIERDALAYHVSALARRAELPTMLSVHFSDLAEGRETLEKLRDKLRATGGASGPWSSETLWPAADWRGGARRFVSPCDFVASFRVSADSGAAPPTPEPPEPPEPTEPTEPRRQPEPAEPAVGHWPSFARTQLLSGSHIRWLFETHKQELESFEASPMLYAVLKNHVVKAPPRGQGGVQGTARRGAYYG